MKAIATYSQSMKLLEKYERKANKRYGQNFIIDPNIVRKIASLSGSGGLCLEIGPGLGALTQQLAANYDGVIAYEIDRYMVEILNESLDGLDNVQIIHEDFLKADLSHLDQRLTVCANLPYYITTPILFRLMELDVQAMTLMVQKEIAERLSAVVKTKAYSALSIQVQHYFAIETLMKVSPQAFHPRPKVDSIVLKMIPRNQTLPYDERLFFAFVRACFQFRRKTLINNLKTLDLAVDYPAVFADLGLDVSVRADTLTMADFLRLYGVLYA